MELYIIFYVYFITDIILEVKKKKKKFYLQVYFRQFLNRIFQKIEQEKYTTSTDI